MAHEVAPIAPPSSPDEPEEPTEWAVLQIQSAPPNITVSGQGAVTSSLVLGVIGPAATIAVGSIASFPVWAIVVICALQILAAYFRRKR